MTKKYRDKLYVIKKYVKAPTAAIAIKRERDCPVDDVWIDDEWRKNERDRLADSLGFVVPSSAQE